MDMTEAPPQLEALYESKKGAPRFSLAGFRGWAYCSDVYDGDTCQLSFMPHGMETPYRWTCRLARIETAETGHRASTETEQKMADAARDRLSELVLGSLVTIFVQSMGKYGRPVVELYVGDVNVNNLLMDEGHAVPYGSKDVPWDK